MDGLIYNYVQLLRDQFTTEVIYANIKYKEASQEFVSDRCLIVTETGGSEQPWTQYGEPTIQVIARDFDAPDARKLAWDVFEYITSRFGLILPAVTVKSVTYPSIQTAQISAIQRPQSIGSDENGRTIFTTNYKFIFVRS